MTTPPVNLHAATIDDVIVSLDKIVEWAKENKKNYGYFAALYRKVTIMIRTGIEQGEFQDGKRMEKLDVIFANRYLDAFEAWFAGKTVTNSWKLVFNVAERRTPVVLQHLMLGMNAHINLDLGIAAAETVTESDLPDLKADFEMVNNILISLVDEVQDDLARIWPLLKLIDRLAGDLDEKLADNMMVFARDSAWDFATKYAASADKHSAIAGKDREMHLAGVAFMSLALYQLPVLLLIRLTERGGVKHKIEILA